MIKESSTGYLRSFWKDGQYNKVVSWIDGGAEVKYIVNSKWCKRVENLQGWGPSTVCKMRFLEKVYMLTPHFLCKLFLLLHSFF